MSNSTATCRTNKANTTKKLRFDPKTRIYLIPTIAELTGREYESLYRTEEDEKMSLDELTKTLIEARQNNGTLPEEHQDCLTLRGVEHMASHEAATRRTARKRLVLDAILDEQDLHFDAFEAGKTSNPLADASKIAQISQQLSRDSRYAAEKRGRQDEVNAKALNVD